MFSHSRNNPIYPGFCLPVNLYSLLVSAAHADTRNVVIAADHLCFFICDMGGPQQGLTMDTTRQALVTPGYEHAQQQH